VKKDQLLPAIGLILLATLCFSAMDTTGKLIVAQLPIMMVVWGRTLVQTVLVGVFLGATQGPRFFHTRRPLAQFTRGAILLATGLLTYAALRHVPLADTIAALFFSPVLVVVFSAVFLKEKVGIHRIGAVLAGFAGVLLIVRPGMAGFNPWLLLAVAAAIVNTGFLLLTRVLSDPSERAATHFHTTSFAALAMCVLVVPYWQTPGPGEAAVLLAMGALGTVGHFLLIRAFQFAPASLLSPFLYVQVFFTMLASTFIIGDPLTLPTVAGAALLVASGVYIWWRERKRGLEPTPPVG